MNHRLTRFGRSVVTPSRSRNVARDWTAANPANPGLSELDSVGLRHLRKPSIQIQQKKKKKTNPRLAEQSDIFLRPADTAAPCQGRAQEPPGLMPSHCSPRRRRGELVARVTEQLPLDASQRGRAPLLDTKMHHPLLLSRSFLEGQPPETSWFQGATRAGGRVE
ncbi:unnamed protein product [Lampetra planeri]